MPNLATGRGDDGGERRPRPGGKRRTAQRSALLAEIQERRGVFGDAVRRARVVKPELDPAVAALVKDVLGDGEAQGEFGALAAATAPPDFDRKRLARRATDLARLRVYVLPVEDLAVEGRDVYAELSEWQVPAVVLANLHQTLTSDLSGTYSAAAQVREEEMRRTRTGLLKVVETYDYWDRYTDWFFATLRNALGVLFVVFVLSLAGAVGLLFTGDVGSGFILAGLSGAAVSIMLKLPPLSVFGEVASFAVKMVGRGAAGMAAAAIGVGALSVGLVNIPLIENGKAVSRSVLINACARADGEAQAPATAASAERGAGPALVPSQGGTAPAATTAPGCSTVWRLVLLALGMLLGFSERALASFEDAAFGTQSAQGPAPPAVPPAVAPGGQPPAAAGAPAGAPGTR